MTSRWMSRSVEMDVYFSLYNSVLYMKQRSMPTSRCRSSPKSVAVFIGISETQSYKANHGWLRASLSVGRFVGEVFSSDEIKSLASVRRKSENCTEEKIKLTLGRTSKLTSRRQNTSKYSSDLLPADRYSGILGPIFKACSGLSNAIYGDRTSTNRIPICQTVAWQPSYRPVLMYSGGV